MAKKIKNTELAINHFWKQQFISAKDSRSWVSKACNLKYAADTLCKISQKAIKIEHNNFVKSTEDGTFKNGHRELSKKEVKLRLDTELSWQCFLLWGFAFENMLKGILISKHPEFVHTRGIDKQLKTHNLIELAKKCAVKLDKTETKILERLTKDIIWRQRYPIPLNLERMISTKFGIGATNVVDAYFPDLGKAEGLFLRLEKLLMAKNF